MTFIPFVLVTRSFFFSDTATTEIYTLSLHDALPILPEYLGGNFPGQRGLRRDLRDQAGRSFAHESQGLDERRSEEHTSELQSLTNLVCRLLLEKKKN